MNNLDLKLILDSCGMGNQGVEQIASALPSMKCQLKRLVLRYDHRGALSVVLCIDGYVSFKCWRVYVRSNNGISDLGVDSIAEGIIKGKAE